jgi:SAM-dependent methyltransferase
MSSAWKSFWNKENNIYVSARHKEVHFLMNARDLLRLIPSGRPLTLLDWGCGEALGAAVLADANVRVLLHDPVPLQEKRLKERFSGNPRIEVLDARDIAGLPAHTIEVILLNSVLQYIGKEEFQKLLPGFRNLLTPEGVLFLGDVVPSDSRISDDALALLGAGIRHGFFFEALFGLVTTFFSDYRKVRQTDGFTTYTEEEIINILTRAGFRAERVQPNIGLTSHRMLIRAILS